MFWTKSEIFVPNLSSKSGWNFILKENTFDNLCKWIHVFFFSEAVFEYKSSQVVKEYWCGEWVEVSEVGSISCSVFSTDIIKFNSFSVVHFEIQKKKKVPTLEAAY